MEEEKKVEEQDTPEVASEGQSEASASEEPKVEEPAEVASSKPEGKPWAGNHTVGANQPAPLRS